MSDVNTFTGVNTDDVLFAGYFNGLIAAVTPIGTVIAWLKSFTGTPATMPDGWVECDGSVISDSDSVYDGITLPDLNGENRFIRGSDTSGDEGGSETANYDHNHTNSTSENWDSDSDCAYTNTNETTTLDGLENRPPYYNVVWIMRIK